MSKKFIIIILIIVALVATGFVWKNQKQAMQKEQVAKVSPTSSISPTPIIDGLVGNAKTIDEIDTSNWKTYISPNKSFSYKYPPVGITSRNLGVVFRDDSQKDPYMQVGFIHGGIDTHAPDRMEKKYITLDSKEGLKTIFIDKEKIYQIYISFTADDSENLFKKYGFSWIEVYYYPSDFANSEKYLLLGEKIVSTIKFLK